MKFMNKLASKSKRLEGYLIQCVNMIPNIQLANQGKSNSLHPYKVFEGQPGVFCSSTPCSRVRDCRAYGTVALVKICLFIIQNIFEALVTDSGL